MNVKSVMQSRKMQVVKLSYLFPVKVSLYSIVKQMVGNYSQRGYKLKYMLTGWHHFAC